MSCIQVILNEAAELTPSMIRYFAEVPIFVRNFDDIEQRNITDNSTKLLHIDCQNFVFVTVHLKSVVQRLLFFDRIRFLPFSRIFFVHNVNESFAGLSHQFQKHELNYVYKFAVFVYILTFRMDVLSAVQDVQTGIYLEVNNDIDIGSLLYNDWHKYQFIHIKNENKDFRIGLYNCSPYVVYLDDNGTKYVYIVSAISREFQCIIIYIYRMDGIEYRLVQEVARNWNVLSVHRDYSENVKDPWLNITNDIIDDLIDMGMCSIWLDAERDMKFDLSTYYDHQCTTMVVPKPCRLNEVTDIYLPFRKWVWVFFLCSAVVTSLLLTYMAKVGAKMDRRYQAVFAEGSRTVLEIVSTATSHGVHFNPKQTSINILLIRYIYIFNPILNLLFVIKLIIPMPNFEVGCFFAYLLECPILLDIHRF